MGCGSSQFTEDDAVFFGGKPFVRDRPNLNEDLVSQSSLTKLTLKKGLLRVTEDYVVKTADGQDYVKVVHSQGEKKIYTMGGEFVASMHVGARHSEVNGIDASFALPHIYIHATKPLKDDQEPCREKLNEKEGNKSLYMWARVHKASLHSGSSKFEVALAEFQGTPEGQNLEKFGYKVFSANLFGDGRMQMKKRGQGCCQVCFADDDSYTVTVAASIDPVLMLCAVMCMESLKDQ